MAATNLVAIDRSNKDRIFHYHGTGVIAAADALVTDVKKYPKGTVYTNTAGRTMAIRTSEAGVIGDWSVFTGAAAT